METQQILGCDLEYLLFEMLPVVLGSGQLLSDWPAFKICYVGPGSAEIQDTGPSTWSSYLQQAVCVRVCAYASSGQFDSDSVEMIARQIAVLRHVFLKPWFHV